MIPITCRGLTGDWINAWLAAIGAAVLVPGLAVSWTTTARPAARLHHPDTQTREALAELIAGHLPTPGAISQLAIARTHPDSTEQFPRNPTLGAYGERAALARALGDPTIALSLTDLHQPRDGQYEHSPFDPPAPKGTTLWDRMMAVRERLEPDPAAHLLSTLEGTAARVKNNGLGFDHRRFLSPTDPTGEVWVDPAVELLAAVGLTLLPSRGNGSRAAHRGWTDRPTRNGAFTWPTWRAALTAPAIDALLDAHWRGSPPPEVCAVYGSVAYRPRSSMDQTRGYAARRLR
jgi:hypothetical protein